MEMIHSAEVEDQLMIKVVHFAATRYSICIHNKLTYQILTKYVKINKLNNNVYLVSNLLRIHIRDGHPKSVFPQMELANIMPNLN